MAPRPRGRSVVSYSSSPSSSSMEVGTGACLLIFTFIAVATLLPFVVVKQGLLSKPGLAVPAAGNRMTGWFVVMLKFESRHITTPRVPG